MSTIDIVPIGNLFGFDTDGADTVRAGVLLPLNAGQKDLESAMEGILERSRELIKGEPNRSLFIVDRRRSNTVVMAMVGRAS